MTPEEEQERLEKDQQRIPDESASDPQVTEKSGMLKCPKCGSSNIRKRSLYFFISIAIFVGLFVLMLVLRGLVIFLHDSGFVIGLSLILITITHFWPAVICGAACFAFVGRHRCLSCKYRFRPIRGKKQLKNGIPFPWRFSILNGVIIFIIFTVSGNIYYLRSHFSFSAIVSRLVFWGIFASIPAAFFIVLSLPYQAIIYHFLRAKIRNSFLWAILFLLPAAALGGDLIYRHQPEVAANRILANGELAPLPASATGIKVYTWSSPFSGEEFLRFQAAQEDIELFLKTSPILKDKECQIYSKDRMRLPRSIDSFGYFDEADPNKYFTPSPSAPDWYIEELRGAGRQYDFKPRRYHYPGELIIDDEKNLIFIRLCFS